MDLRVFLSDREEVVRGVESITFSEAGELEIHQRRFPHLPLSPTRTRTFQAPWRLEPLWTEVTVTLPSEDVGPREP